MWKKILQSQGSIALILVIMITSLTLISAVALTLVNISEKMANYQLEENENVLNQKQACLDDALARISNDNYATGTYALDLTDVHCYYQISETITGLKTVTTTASSLSSIGTWSQSLKAIVNVSSTPISITSHQDIVGPTWDRTNWGRRMRISVQPNKVAGDLYNFPVYVNLADLGDDFFNAVQSDGSDIVVTLGDGTTKLLRELSFIDKAGGLGEVHFLAPYLSSQVATDFYIYFGNPAGAEVDDDGLWTNYQMVQHFTENPASAAPQMIDSTGRGHNGTSNGTMLAEDLVTTQVGKGLYFDENDDSISVADPANFGSAHGTISFWASSTSHGQMYLSFYPAVNNAGAMFFGETSFPMSEGELTEIYSASMVRVVDRTYVLSAPEKLGWHKMDWRQDGSGVDLFFDGQEVNLTGTDSNSYWNDHFTASAVMIARFVGQGPGGGLHTMDEIRVTNKALSAQWLATEYNNQFDSDTFYSTSTVENLGCSGVEMFGYCWYQASAVSMSCDQVCAANSLSCVSSVSYSDPTCALNVALGPPVAPNTCSAGCSAGGGLTYDPGNHTLADFCLHDATSPAISCASTEISGVFQIICACE